MVDSRREPVIAGNWKMYKTAAEGIAFIEQIRSSASEASTDVYLAVPFTALQAVAVAAEGSSVVVGAQNMHDAAEGAFTGEISAAMLLDAGARFVILGHSERRHIFGESSAFVNRKVKRALEVGLQPIVCVGETFEQRDAGETNHVLASQLKDSLEGIDADAAQGIIVAYEPVWAIGTGKTATPEQAQKEHAFCRSVLATLWDEATAEKIRIQYGGSVKPANSSELLSQPDVDGLLVGGASLDAESFCQIILSINKVVR